MPANYPVSASSARSALGRRALISAGLVLLTLLAYAPVTRNGFTNYDDPHYLTQNAVVRQGLSRQSLRYAFVDSFGVGANWHPLTWLSHMLDVQWFGMDPGLHHLSSAIFQAISAAILFLSLATMTGANGRSALVAAIFAIHPLQVQSVAWAAERKEVLSALFWMLTMWCYAEYVRRPGAWRYALVIIAFVLGLLSKPMLVTLPFVLLLLDVWPLGRTALWTKRQAASGDTGAGLAASRPQSLASSRQQLPRTWTWLILEKLPLLALAAASSVVTVLAQRAGGAMSEGRASFSFRVANAVVSYVRYVGKFFWPSGLEIFYRFRDWSPALAWACAAALVAITLAALLLLRRRPYLAIGWLWFLGTLVPVIGLVQVGAQAMADRYMHIPMIGLAIAVCGGAADVLRAWHVRWLGPVLSAGVLAVCAWRTVVEIGYWKDSRTLFTRAIEITPDNVLAHHNLAMVLSQEGQQSDAILEELRAAVSGNPQFADAHDRLGVMLTERGEYLEAEQHLLNAIALEPNRAVHRINLAFLYTTTGRFAEAAKQYQQVVRLEPQNLRAWYSLAFTQLKLGHRPAAAEAIRRALQRLPNLPDTDRKLTERLLDAGRLESAARMLGLLLAERGEFGQAAAQSAGEELPRARTIAASELAKTSPSTAPATRP